MHCFTALTGQEINVEITIATVRRVRSLLKIDLTKPNETVDLSGSPMPLVAALQGLDVMVLVDVLYAVCKPQLEKLGLTDEDFAGLLAGNVLGAAQDALLAEWLDFFRGLNRPDAIQLIQAGQNVVKAGINKATRLAKDAETKGIQQLSNFSTNATESPEPLVAEIPVA